MACRTFAASFSRSSVPTRAEPSGAGPTDPGTFWAEHARFVEHTLARLGVDPTDREDLRQEVFIVVIKRLADYEARGRHRAWLFGICLRVVAGYRRRGYRRHERVASFATPCQTPAPGDDPEQAAVERSRRRELDGILARMDPERRAVLVMFELDELDCAQIARSAAIPVGTVYSRLHAARRQFKELAAHARELAGQG